MDFTRSTFTALDTKNHKSHCLPITAPTLEILKNRYQSKANDYVFPARKGVGHLINPKKQITKVIAAMNLEINPHIPLPELNKGCFNGDDLPKIYFTIHDLRRTFAGIARREVGGGWTSRLLNHISDQEGAAVTKRHYLGEEIAEELRIPLEKVVERIMVLGRPEKTVPLQHKMQFVVVKSFCNVM